MTFTPQHNLVWAEIPVTDLDAATAFYTATTGATLQLATDAGPNPMVDFKPMEGGVALHLYPGKPATDGQGPTVHLAIDCTAEEAMQRVTEAGGTVVSPVIDIPPGRFFYAQDPDGNSVGYFETRRAA